MLHIICIFVVLFLRADPHPEEVLWLLPLINHLGDKHHLEKSIKIPNQVTSLGLADDETNSHDSREASWRNERNNYHSIGKGQQILLIIFPHLGIRVVPHVHRCIYLLAVCVVEHAVHDVLCQLGFIRVGSSAHPCVNDALVVGALKRYLQKPKRRTGQHRERGPLGRKGFVLYVVVVTNGNNPNLEDEAEL